MKILFIQPLYNTHKYYIYTNLMLVLMQYNVTKLASHTKICASISAENYIMALNCLLYFALQDQYKIP